MVRSDVPSKSSLESYPEPTTESGNGTGEATSPSSDSGERPRQCLENGESNPPPHPEQSPRAEGQEGIEHRDADRQPDVPATMTQTKAESDVVFAARLNTLNSLTAQLTQQENISDLLYTVVEKVAQLLSVDRSSIVLLERGTNQGLVVASSDDATIRNHPVDLQKYPEIVQAVKTAQPIIIHDSMKSSLIASVLDEAPLRFASMALVPIVGAQGPLAVLYLRRTARNNFSTIDLAYAQAIANATGIALSNAQTLEHLRRETALHQDAQQRAAYRLEELGRYVDFFESSRDALLVINQKGRILYANQAALRLSPPPRAQESHPQRGKTPFTDVAPRDSAPDEQQTDPIAQDQEGLLAYIHPSHTALLKEIIEGLSQDILPAGVDMRLRTGLQQPTIVSGQFSRVSSENQTYLVTMRDVTRERHLGRQLAQTRDFLSRIIESSVDGIVSADLRGRVLVFNEAASQMLGYSKEDALIGLKVSQLYPNGVAQDIMKRIHGTEFGGAGRLKDYRVDLKAKNGVLIPVALSASLLMEGKTPVGTVGVFTDIRERLQMESQLQYAREELQSHEKQAVIAQVAGGAAHELNQPLTSILGYTEYLKRRIPEDEKSQNALSVILSQTQRMADIVKKVGQLSHVESKPYVGKAKIVDLERSTSPQPRATIASIHEEELHQALSPEERVSSADQERRRRSDE
ncbi:MAG: PAS domain S-box protein [Polyangiaceae bacterium]|nr:PAS domain S-box protein [Polyangiaceae bacterium]